MRTHSDCTWKAPDQTRFSAWGQTSEPQTFLVPLQNALVKPENADELSDTLEYLPGQKRVRTLGPQAGARAGGPGVFTLRRVWQARKLRSAYSEKHAVVSARGGTLASRCQRTSVGIESAKQAANMAIENVFPKRRGVEMSTSENDSPHPFFFTMSGLLKAQSCL